MNNVPDFDRLIEPFIEIYKKIEHDLIVHIATHFQLYENIGFKNSMEWYIRKVEELGGLNQQTVDLISKQSKIPKDKITKMLKDVGLSTLNLEDIKEANEKGLFHVDIDKLVNSNTFNDIVNHSYKEINDIFKLINTKAIESSKQLYMDVLNQAYTEVRSGIDYNTAVRKALTKMANQGITVATYKQKNGTIRKYGIESCVRRDVLTAVVQATNRMSDNVCNEVGYEYVIVSKHLGARVTDTHDYKDHACWQGKVYKIDGSTEEYPNFQEICNEGDVQGFGGANCRHVKFGFIPGISVLPAKNINEEENRKIYELQKKQRQYENKIKDYQTQIDVAKTSKDLEKANLYKNKLKKLDKEYNQFCKDNNLKRRYNREQIIDVKTKTINNQKLSSYKDVTQDWLDKATPNSHEVKDMNYFEYNSVKYEVDGKNVVLDYSPKEKETAEWLESTFGGEIYMVPRVNNPEGISTSDYLWNNEFWDLKEITGNGKHTLDTAIKKKKSQSSNFLFDITNSKISNEEAIRQLKLIFKTKDRKWIKKIMLKRNKNVIIISEHQKRD